MWEFPKFPATGFLKQVFTNFFGIRSYIRKFQQHMICIWRIVQFKIVLYNSLPKKIFKNKMMMYNNLINKNSIVINISMLCNTLSVKVHSISITDDFPMLL